jgi:translation initiation factor 1
VKNNPFGDLRKRLGLPDPPDSGPLEAQELRTGDGGLRTVLRAVIRYERSGRGGKDVTVIEQLGLKDAELQTWLKQLKSALGCGGSVEGGSIMLQGDHRKRLPAILTERGVRKVTVG